MMTKKWYTDETLWVNVLTFAAGILGYSIAHDLIASNAEWVAILIALQGAVNVILRFISRKSIEV